MKGRFSKLKPAITVAKIITPSIVTLVWKSWVVSNRVPNVTLIGNDKQFILKCFAILRASLGIELVTPANIIRRQRNK